MENRFPDYTCKHWFNLHPILIAIVLSACLIPLALVLPYLNINTDDLNDIPQASADNFSANLIQYLIWHVFGIASALLTGTLAVVGYTSRKNISGLIVGSVFLAVGLYDIFSLLVGTLFPAKLYAESIYLKWFISRSLYAALLTGSVIYFIFINKNASRLLFTFLLFLLIAIIITIGFQDIPQQHTPGRFITRPFELIILAIYLALGFILLPVIRIPSFFASLIILSIIPSAFADALMAIHKQYFDIFFNTAYFLRFIGYLVPLAGFGVSYIQTSRKDRNLIKKLRTEIRERILRQKNLEDSKASLAKTGAELETTVEELKRSNAELGQFAYVASHDLQEPLRKIRAFAGLLEQNYGPLLPDQAKSYVTRMNNAAERLQRLIDDLLSLSKLQKTGYSFIPVNLKDIINDVLSDLEYTIEEKEARIALNVNTTVNVIPVQIRQLFQNLIANSLKFSRKDVPPVITITSTIVRASDTPGKSSERDNSAEYCRIEIKDNGIGFDNRDAERIFKLFQRLHYQSEYEGTGLGLTLCKKITENHSGYIEAEGKEGEGALIKVYLPVYSATIYAPD